MLGGREVAVLVREGDRWLWPGSTEAERALEVD